MFVGRWKGRKCRCVVVMCESILLSYSIIIVILMHHYYAKSLIVASLHGSQLYHDPSCIEIGYCRSNRF